MRIARAEVAVTRTPLRQAVRWTEGGTDAVVEHLRLTLEDANGVRGLSETVCKPAWNGVDGPVLARALERLVWPRIAGATPDEARGVAAGLRGALAVQAAVVNALADLEAEPPAVSCPVAAVVARDDPSAMIDAGAELVEAHGLRALKAKAGAGLDKDRAAIEGLRGVLGAGDVLSVDANSAYGPPDGIALTEIATASDVAFVEDPWSLAPDAATGHHLARAAAPVCADRALDRPDLADGLIDRGVTVLAAKPSRLGCVASAAIEGTARRRGASTVRALFAEGAVGAAFLARGALANGTAPDFPVEALFHLGLADGDGLPGLALRDGALHVPAGRLADLAVLPRDPEFTAEWMAP